jgi:hypothetical protein
VKYGSAAALSGVVSSATDVPVRIYRQDAGTATPVLVDTVTAHADQGMAAFSAVVPGMRKSATVFAVASSGDDTLAGRAQVRIAVRALVKLSGRGPLRIAVKPAVSGTATIQRKAGGRWVDFRTVRVAGGAGTVKLPAGTWTVRAKFSGSSLCAPGTSQPLVVTVR